MKGAEAEDGDRKVYTALIIYNFLNSMFKGKKIFIIKYEYTKILNDKIVTRYDKSWNKKWYFTSSRGFDHRPYNPKKKDSDNTNGFFHEMPFYSYL